MPVTIEKLNREKRDKKDEFYTLIETIEKEFQYYSPELFCDKTVFCPCDDYEKSNFCKFFLERFDSLRLKSLICTCYSGQHFTDLNDSDSARGKFLIRDSSGILTGLLRGNGDFRSPEIQEYRDGSDFVITNPPFSLFRDFIEFCKDRKFLVLGNVTAVGYAKIFDMIKTGKMFLGQSIKCGGVMFRMPDTYVSADGSRLGLVPGIRWFTNIQNFPNKPLNLTKKYTPGEYPKYDNLDAIEVSKTKNIPCDYPGLMGVPITFMDKYCPEQFELVSLNGNIKKLIFQGRNVFNRIIIHNKYL